MKLQTTSVRYAAVLIAATAILLGSCQRLEGWGLVRWAPEDSDLTEGSVIPVQHKSNITRSWIVTASDGKTLQEVDLWRIEVFRRRSQAEAAAESFQETANLFALTRRDGLVLRAQATNTANQVYRLRQDETIKLLRKVQGAVVETGGQALEGDWYLALSEDGTQGYVFSNQLLLWDKATEERPDISAGSVVVDARMMDIFDYTWRPDYFISMQNANRVDLNRYQLRFGIFADPGNRQIRVELPWFSKSYRYTSIDQQPDGSFLFRPSGLRIHFSSSGDLVLSPPESDITPTVRRAMQLNLPPQATQDEEPAAELPVSFIFKRQSADPRQVIAAEERRRANVLAALVAPGEYFESLYHGVLVITATGRFTWMNYDILVPEVIPELMGDTGAVSADLFISPEVASSWQGAFTLRFDDNRRAAISFVYRADPNSLTLVPVSPEAIRASTVYSVNPELAIYFMRY